MSKQEILKKFKTKTKEITVKAWDDEKVTIRELSVSEAKTIQEIMVNGANTKDMQNGKMNVSITAFENSKLQTIITAVTSPKFSEDDLNDMSVSAKDGLSEIYEAIGEFNTPKK